MIALAAAVAFSLSAVRPPDACAGIPIDVGTTWTYVADSRWKDAGVAKHATVRWHATVLLAKRRDSLVAVVIRGWPFDFDFVDNVRNARPRTVLLCSAERVYAITVGEGRPAVDVADSVLRRPETVPVSELVVELPLHEGRSWGNERIPEDGWYEWSVDTVAPVPAAIRALGARVTDSVVTLTYRALTDHQTVEFVQGIGVTRYVIGSGDSMALSADVRLIGFNPGVGRSP